VSTSNVEEEKGKTCVVLINRKQKWGQVSVKKVNWEYYRAEKKKSSFIKNECDTSNIHSLLALYRDSFFFRGSEF